ncbi:MAG TPA: MBL fold metallo-hydrolase [Pseudonocardiaceae bacterium]|nr:MBL fold metallo-hydrolase [Pseudonocardiaceae bacterium]
MSPDMQVTLIDTRMGGHAGMTAAYLVHDSAPALVDTGTALSAPIVLAALRDLGLGPDDLAWIVVTHVHLDHAGGAGALAAAFPRARVVVHEVGARHLADPTRLVASSARVHGPLMDTAYGVPQPIPTERIVAAGDRHRVPLGTRSLELLVTPGHAKHHLAAFDPLAGTLFTGDAAGLLVHPMRAPRPATPPPDFDLEAARTSLATMAERDAEHLLLAHFGAVATPSAWLSTMDRIHLDWCAVAKQAGPSPNDIEAALLAAFADDEGLRNADPARFALFGGFQANALGLAHWLGGH